MMRRTLLALALCMGIHIANCQKTENILAIDYFTYEYSGAANLDGKVEMLTFNGSPGPISNPAACDKIRYIFYTGNDWDYDTKELPASWFQLKNLQGIILGNMDFEKEAMENARLKKPGLFLSDASYCYMQWKTINSDTGNLTYYEIQFQTQVRIPSHDELEKLAWKSSLNFQDSLYLLKYMLLNEYAMDDPRYASIKDSVAKWLPVTNILTQPTLPMLDSLLSNYDLPESAQNYAFRLLEKMADKASFMHITDKYIDKYNAQLQDYLPYIDDEMRARIAAKLAIFEKYNQEGKLSPHSASIVEQLRKM